MARVPKLLDVSVPLRQGLPTYPGNPEFELQPIKRIADGGSSERVAARAWARTPAPTSTRPALLRRRRRRRRAAARSADRPRARRRDHQARRHRRRRPRRGRAARGPARPAQDAELRALEQRRLPRGLHLPHRGAARAISSSRASRWSASTTCRSSSSRSRARRRTATLLSNGVIIIEGLNLAEAEPGMYEMYCLPLRVAGGDGAPARVVLKR